MAEFSSATKPIIFVIKRTVLVPEVCPCIRIRSMMHYVHTGEAVVTSIKLTFFMLVTTRPIAHSGRFVCIRNCVGEFGTDTGQSLVTSNIMSNHLSDHHKEYYTHIHTKVHTFYYMWYMGTGENFWSTSKCIFLLSEGPY